MLKLNCSIRDRVLTIINNLLLDTKQRSIEKNDDTC